MEEKGEKGEMLLDLNNLLIGVVNSFIPKVPKDMVSCGFYTYIHPLAGMEYSYPNSMDLFHIYSKKAFDSEEVNDVRFSCRSYLMDACTNGYEDWVEVLTNMKAVGSTYGVEIAVKKGYYRIVVILTKKYPYISGLKKKLLETASDNGHRQIYNYIRAYFPEKRWT